MMKKLKVLHIYKSFNVYNGLIEILDILAQNFDHNTMELAVCVFEYETNPFGKRFEELGGKIFNLSVKQNAVNEPRSFYRLYRFFKEYRPDIVQTHVLKANLMGIAAAKLARVPVVIGTEMTLKDTAPSKVARVRDRFIQPFTSMVINRCDSFVVTSKFIKSEWEKSCAPNLFKIVYPPFNLRKIRDTERNGAKRGAYSKRIGFIGRLSDEKSIDILLEAMSIVGEYEPEAKLTVVGTGPLEESLKRYAEKIGVDKRVNFAGYRSNVFEALKEIDIFVLSSRTEGCPIVILEAMAAGVPVVATRVGGNPELVEDGRTGFLVPHSDPAAMAEAILKLTADSGKASRMGKEGRKVAFTKFHPSKFSDSLEVLYRDLYDRKKLTV
ncbi:glycosyl transferase family 1 [Chitinispirillum alkaliphilum]|nr:glycosyl transferase family 1 [Chitinispirillum alkaliphilum]